MTVTHFCYELNVLTIGLADSFIAAWLLYLVAEILIMQVSTLQGYYFIISLVAAYNLWFTKLVIQFCRTGGRMLDMTATNKRLNEWFKHFEGTTTSPLGAVPSIVSSMSFCSHNSEKVHSQTYCAC